MGREEMIEIIKRMTLNGRLEDKMYSIRFLGTTYNVYAFGVTDDGEATISYSYNGCKIREHYISWLVEDFVRELFNRVTEGRDRNLF